MGSSGFICHIFILFFLGLENTKTWKGGIAALTRQMEKTGQDSFKWMGGRQNDSALTRFLCIRYLHTITLTIPEVTHSYVLYEGTNSECDVVSVARRLENLAVLGGGGLNCTLHALDELVLLYDTDVPRRQSCPSFFI